GVDGFQRLLAQSSETGSEPGIDLGAFAERVRAATQKSDKPRDPLADYEFDKQMLAVLTEYEKHRLRAHVERGHAVFRLPLRVGLEAIETTLQGLKQQIGSTAEVISLLPSSDSSQQADTIGLELLLATAAPEAELRKVLGAAAADLI